MQFFKRNFLARAIIVFIFSFGLSCDGDDSAAVYTVVNIPAGFSLLDSNGDAVTSFQANTVLHLSDGTSTILTFTANGDLDFTNVTLGLSSEKAFAHFASDADKAGITGDVTLHIPALAEDVQVLICPGATSLAAVISGCTDEIALTTLTPTVGAYIWANTDRTGTQAFEVTCDIASFGTGGLGETGDATVGGTLTGLTGTVVLQNNAGDDLTLTLDGAFVFATSVEVDDAYAVTVLTQPVEQNCVVTNAAGTIDDGNITNVTVTCTNDDATLTVTGSPLTLLTNGTTGTLTINNTSLTLTATNISSDFVGTALDGNVTETGNTCSSLAPQTSCVLTYTPGSSVVAETDFLISGTNTGAQSAAIAIDSSVLLDNIAPSSGSAAGGTGFTLTGTNLTGASGVTFGGVAATSINVVNSTTVTGVSPAHAAGAVDVVITTPDGSATLTDGYTYLATSVGQSSSGGTIACLNSGLNNLIAATADNSASIEWGSMGVVTSAVSTTDGATNTATVIATLGANGGTPYAAQSCGNYEVDSQGNTPCEAGNTCYSDWFLPAGNNVAASGQLNCVYTNRAAIGGFSDFYWASTEVDANNSRFQAFTDGAQGAAIKANTIRVRCVRSFTP